jgi:GT2 family glycosyltransferase
MTDDDCTVRSDWVGRAVELLGDDRQRIVTGRVLAAEGAEGDVPSVKDDLERHDYRGTLECRALYSGNMACDREAVLSLGGFDEGLETAEDNDLCYRWLAAERPLSFEPELVVWHHDWRDAAAMAGVYLGYWRGQGEFYGKHLRAGDLRVLRFLRSDVKWWLAGMAARTWARVMLRKAAPVGEARGFLRGVSGGIRRGWSRRR